MDVSHVISYMGGDFANQKKQINSKEKPLLLRSVGRNRLCDPLLLDGHARHL